MAACPFYSLMKILKLTENADDYDVSYETAVAEIPCMGASCQLWRSDDCVINKIYDKMGDGGDVLNAITDVNSSVNDTNTSVGAVGTAVDTVNTSVGAVSDAVDVVGSAVDAVNSSVGAVGAAVGSVNSSVGAVGVSVDAVNSAVGAVGASVDAVGSSVDAVNSSVGAVGSSVDAVNTSVGAVGSAVDAVNSSVNEVNAAVGEVNSSVTALKDALEGMDEWLKKVLGDEPDVDDSGPIIKIMQLLRDEFAAVVGVSDSVDRGTLNALSQEIAELLEKFGDWSQILVGTEEEVDDIGSIIKQLIHINKVHWDRMAPYAPGLAGVLVNSYLGNQDITIAELGVYGKDWHIPPDKTEKVPTGETDPETGEPIYETVEVIDPKGQKPAALVGLPNGGAARSWGSVVRQEDTELEKEMKRKEPK